jgi:hypothetical protein
MFGLRGGQPVQRSDLRRAIAGGGTVTLVASIVGAHLWDPPMLGLALIFSAGAPGTMLVLGVRAISTHGDHRKENS